MMTITITFNNGLLTYKHIYFYITHTGYHSEIHVYTICYQVSDSSTKSKIQVVSNFDNIVGSFYKPAVE